MRAFVLRLAALLALLGPTTGHATETLQAAEGAKPDFALTDLTGATISLAAQRGRVVLVHFFATWCEPCREELPALTRLVARSGTPPVTVLAISVGEVDARVARFMAGIPVNFPVLLDRDRAVAKSWDAYTLPTTYVLDETLAARLVANGDFAWDALSLDELRARLVAPPARQTGHDQRSPVKTPEGG